MAGSSSGNADVDHGSDDLDDCAFVHASTPQPFVDSLSHLPFGASGLPARSAQPSASAPATTSRISWVMDAWRARFIASV